MSSALVPRAPIRRTLRRLRPLGFLVVGLAFVVLVVATFVAVDTNWLWFDSVHYSADYARELLSEVVMFLIFGGATAVGTGVVTWLVARLRPRPDPGPLSWTRTRWRSLSRPVRRLLLVLIPVVAGLRTGFAAAGNWQLWLLWRNAVPVGLVDPRFHRDYGFFLFTFPLYRYVDFVLTTIVGIGIATLIVVGYLRGVVRIRGARPRTTPGFRLVFAILMAVLALIKAWAYWLDRLGTVTSSRGPVTGQSWTDLHVVLPMKLVLIAIALLLAVLFVVSAVRRSSRLTLVGIATMIAAGIIFGGVVPALFQTFAVKPSAVTAEATSIARNIEATQYGFGLDGLTTTVGAPSGRPATADTLTAAVQPRIIDPNVVPRTFTQYQQRTSYYRFKPTLDVDRYDIHGRTTDVVIGVRELRLSGLSLKSWTNQHLVYTHGIGVVAAPTSSATSRGVPDFTEYGIPSRGALGSQPALQDRIYFGQYSPAYSVVGAPPGHGKEFDQPGESRADYAYTGRGGVPIASVWHRLVYALRFRDKNLLFAGGFNRDSQLLYLRNPATRVKTVAPWLTLDGDVYPVVDGGRVTWVADGYTTSSSLPDSQEVNLQKSTMTTYVKQGATTKQASVPVNYIRNSVVATVDAYSGAVNLYQKPGSPTDPILAAWMRAFPGLVKPASALPPALRPHLRYPEDLFNVQRAVLAKYHGERPGAFYAGTQFWVVPGDPTVAANVAQPSYYATLDNDGRQEFSLTTPLLTLNRSNIAAYLTVDCDEGPGYGKLRLVTVPQQVPTESPRQLQNDIESDPTIARTLSLERTGQSSIKVGNLQTVLVDGQVLAIEPIYEQAKSGQNYPLLRHVVVIYGSQQPGFAATFPQALREALGVAPRSGSARALADQAQQALTMLERAQSSGDKAAIARAQRALTDAITELQAGSR